MSPKAAVEFDPEKIFNSRNTDMPVAMRKYACTVVSLLPREIFEEKPHMLPSTFKIPAAVYGDISILHVEEGIHYVPNAFDNRNLKQITPPAEMARSIVDDYKSSHIGLGEDAEPGLFWVEGRLSSDEVKQYHKDKIEIAAARQRNWFHNLIAEANADWEKNHDMRAVSDLQRLAARSLGIQKDWVSIKSQETVQCPFCKFAIAVGSIKCINCKEVVDLKAYEALVGGKNG